MMDALQTTTGAPDELSVFLGLAALARDITVTGVLLIGFWLWLTDRIVTRTTLTARLEDAEKRVVDAKNEATREREEKTEWKDNALEALQGLRIGVSTTATAVRQLSVSRRPRGST